MNLTLNELIELEYGEVIDLMIEAANDNAKYDELAIQEDMDNAFK